MKIVDLTEQLLRRLKVRDFEKSDLGDNFLKDNLDKYLGSEYRKAVIDNEGEVLFVFGGKQTSEFGIWVWILGSEGINKNPVASLEILISMEAERIEFHKARGVKYFYTFNNPDFPFAIRFLERIGYSQKDKAMFKDGVERILLLKEI